MKSRTWGGSGIQGKEEAALTSGFKSGCCSGLWSSGGSLDHWLLSGAWMLAVLLRLWHQFFVATIMLTNYSNIQCVKNNKHLFSLLRSVTGLSWKVFLLWILLHLWGGWLAVGWSRMAMTGWLGWLQWTKWLSSLSSVHTEYVKPRHILTAWQRYMSTSLITQGMETHSQFSSFCLQTFASILLAKANYMAKSRVRVGRTTKLQVRGCNSARPLTGAISTISLPPGLHSQGLCSVALFYFSPFWSCWVSLGQLGTTNWVLYVGSVQVDFWMSPSRLSLSFLGQWRRHCMPKPVCCCQSQKQYALKAL